MKKVLSITMSIFMLISMFAFCVSAKNPIYGDYEYRVIEDGSVAIVGYKGSDKEIIIPETIADKTVTIIDDYAFYENYDVRSVVIANGVKAINESAFEECILLDSIYVPDSVTTIGDYAFAYCDSLKNIKLGKGIKKIGSFAFHACNYTFSNVDESGCVYVDNYLISFFTTENLDVLNVREGTVLISDRVSYSLRYNDRIKEIILPDSLKYVGERAFECMKALEYVKIGNSTEYIGECAFFNCNNLKNVKVPSSVKTIGKKAFGYVVNKKRNEISLLDGFTLTGYANTAAEKYANKNGIEFKFQKPQTPKVKITAGDKKIKVKYTKALGADGFQISYTVGKKTYTKTYETAKTTTKTLKNLKKGTYQVKVRAFTKTDTKKIYSKWTDTVSVKVK